MVAQTTPQLPPPLTDEETTLLTKYVGYRFDLHGLSRETQYNIFDLTRWLLQPHIQANLQAYLGLLKLQHEAEHAAAKSAGIANLIDIVNSTQDDKERRRAATTLVRVGSVKPLPEEADGAGSRRRSQPPPPDARECAPAHQASDLSQNTPPPDWYGHRPTEPEGWQANRLEQPHSHETQAAEPSGLDQTPQTIEAQYSQSQAPAATPAISQPTASNTS